MLAQSGSLYAHTVCQNVTHTHTHSCFVLQSQGVEISHVNVTIGFIAFKVLVDWSSFLGDPMYVLDVPLQSCRQQEFLKIS